MPAIILVELLAQTGGIAAAAPPPGDPPSTLQLRVAAIGPFKFPAAAGPGMTLEARARVAGRIGGLFKIEGTVTADGVLVATGSLTLAGVTGDARHETHARHCGSGFVESFTVSARKAPARSVKRPRSRSASSSAACRSTDFIC